MSKKTNKQRKSRERGLNVKVSKATKSSKSGAVRINNNFDKKAKKKQTKKTAEVAEATDAKATEERAVEAKVADAKVAEERAKDAEMTEERSKDAAKKESDESVEAKIAQTDSHEDVPTENIKLPASFSRSQTGYFDDINWAEPGVILDDGSESEAKLEAEANPEVKTDPEIKETSEPKVLEAETDSKIEMKSEVGTGSEAEANPEVETVDNEKAETDPEAPVDDERDETASALSSTAFSESSETLRLDTSATKNYDSKILIRDVERILPEDETALYRQTDNENFNLGAFSQEQHRDGLSTFARKTEDRGSVSETSPEIAPDNFAKKDAAGSKIAPRPSDRIPATTNKSAKAIKEREIKKAIDNASALPKNRQQRKRFSIRKIGWPRIVLATSCVATAIFAVAYFVNLSASDMSIKVAAMQSGIEASYPNYIPRGYSLSDVTSSNGKVVMRFKSGEDEYVLSEENSAWDSNALLTNFIEPEYGDDYTLVREQGLALYMSDRWEAWVNGGKLYKLTVTSGSLTKKQLKTIATSL